MRQMYKQIKLKLSVITPPTYMKKDYEHKEDMVTC